MNEVSSIRGVNSIPVVPASSKGAAGPQELPNSKHDTGNSLPLANQLPTQVVTDNSDDVRGDEASSQGFELENIEDAVASMNDFVQTVQRDLQFTVDEELEKTIVKVLDSESGEVIRQIPEQTFLELARNMKEYGEIRFIDETS